MLLSKFIYIKISSSNVKYWKSKGYDVKAGGRAGINNGQVIKVRCDELLPGSNADVSCRCDQCGTKYIQRFCRDKDTCYDCRKTKQMLGNTLGRAGKGKKLPSMQGDKHPRWNPNKSEQYRYYCKVRGITEKNYKLYKHLINPNDHPRTLCGVENGYQLDHKISIKAGFEQQIPAEVLGSLENLQMLSWQDNRAKWDLASYK